MLLLTSNLLNDQTVLRLLCRYVILLIANVWLGYIVGTTSF